VIVPIETFGGGRSYDVHYSFHPPRRFVDQAMTYSTHPLAASFPAGVVLSQLLHV
jgi:hypothetical protein